VNFVRLNKDDPPVSRTCGSCRLCCKLVGVYIKDETEAEHFREFTKHPFQWCPHACSDGCSQYETRPYACREYQCFWLQGLGHEAERPDKLHLLIHIENMGTEDDMTIVGCVYQQNPAAFKNKKSLKFIALAANFLFAQKMKIGLIDSIPGDKLKWTQMRVKGLK
jgi:hypothetical protein